MAQQKREAERAYVKMTPTEKELFKGKMVKIDEADAGNSETLPPTPTPV